MKPDICKGWTDMARVNDPVEYYLEQIYAAACFQSIDFYDDPEAAMGFRDRVRKTLKGFKESLRETGELDVIQHHKNNRKSDLRKV